MKNYVKYFLALVLLVVFVIPFNVFASEVTNVFINSENKLSFTKSGDYNVYQVYIKQGETQIDAFGHNAGGVSTYDLATRIASGCESNPDTCEYNYVGNYTLEIVALDTANSYVEVEETRTTKTIAYKTQFFNGDDYNHVDVVGNETKYTITLDPDNEIDDPQDISNLTFGQHVQLSSIESYGFTKLPKRLYYGWQYEEFNVTQNMTVSAAWEPLLTMSLNFNGGTLNGQGTFSKEGVGYAPSLSLENLLSAFGEDNEVIPPAGKELDYVTINGVQKAVDPEDGFMFSQDTEIVYYWKWSEGTVRHNVTFEDGFDNVLSTVEVADGQAVAQPANPVIGGLQFDRWKVGESNYDFSTPVTGDLTISAHWWFNYWATATPSEGGIVNLVGVGEKYEVYSSGYYNEGDLTTVEQQPVEGYVLKEWRIGSSDGTLIGTDPSANMYVQEDGNLKLRKSPETSGKHYYAIYEKAKVAVTFNTNGGTAIDTQYVIPGERATKPGLYDSTKEGYLVGGWYTNPELTNEFNFYTPVETAITLYAKWDVYLEEVRGTVNKPVDGFKADTNIVSEESNKYAFEANYWYLIDSSLGYPHLGENDVYEKDKEYEIRLTVVPKPGYAVDHYTRYFINGEETSCYGSAEDRQIRWTATEAKKVTDFNITGIVTPVEDKTFNNGNIRLNTEGLTIKNLFWTEESTGNQLKSTDKFVAGKRYILHVVFDTNYGYVLAENYDEGAISGSNGFLKSEFVNNFDALEMQIYYQAAGIPLSTPSLSISKINNNSITLKWNKSGTKFEVYQSLDNKKWSKVSTTTGTEYTASGLTFNKTYYFKVRATNGSKWSGYSKVVSKKIVPNKVSSISITGIGTGSVTFKYEKVAATGYEIYRSTDNKKWSLLKTITNNNTTQYTDKKLKANKVYYYKVRAYKTVSGKKIYGSFSSIITPRTAPTKPTFTLSLRDYNAMNLKIDAVGGATKYIVHKSLNGTNYSLVTELTKAGTIVQSNLEIGKTYYYRVKACNSQNNCSAWVVVSKMQTTLAPGFKLSTTSKKVTVTLTSVKEATGYEIYRSTSKNGKYKLVKTLLSTDGLSFINGTKKGTKYFYKIRSYKVVNNKKIYSPYSAIKNIKSK